MSHALTYLYDRYDHPNKSMDVIKRHVTEKNVNSFEHSQLTPFMQACLHGHIEGVNYMLNLRADPHLKSQHDSLSALDLVVSNKAHDIRKCDNAVLHIVKLLIEQFGCTVQTETTSWKRNLLLTACYGQYYETIKYLISKFQFDISNNYFKAVLRYSSLDIDMGLHLIKSRCCFKDKHENNFNEDTCIKIVDLLWGTYIVDRPFDTERVSQRLTTPLMLACFYGFTKLVKHLTNDLQCDPHAIDNYDCSCLMYATVGSYDVICYLIDTYKCSLIQTDKYGMDCFDIIWYFQYQATLDFVLRFVTKFVDSGYIITLKNLQNFVKCNHFVETRTILLIYMLEHSSLSQNELDQLLISIVNSCRCTLEQVKYLVELKGASVKYVSECGYTCVNRCYDVDIINYLVGKGANINSCINTFISMCNSNGRTDLLECYIENEIDTTLEGKYWDRPMTPLEAINKNNKVPLKLKDFVTEQNKTKMQKC